MASMAFQNSSWAALTTDAENQGTFVLCSLFLLFGPDTLAIRTGAPFFYTWMLVIERILGLLGTLCSFCDYSWVFHSDFNFRKNERDMMESLVRWESTRHFCTVLQTGGFGRV
jgi:hypothetical protein